jgi:hypothetical protein
MGFQLNDVPRGEIERQVAAKAQTLPKEPPNYKGDCDLFRPAKGRPPYCTGKCGRARRCKLLIVCREGSHSDRYDVLVTCTCLSKRELDELFERPEAAGAQG